MLCIEVLEDQSGRIVAFYLNGHAGYAAYGEDIVCAGVSALTQTALLGLEHFLKEKSPDIQFASGNLNCKLPTCLNAQEREQADVILETMYLGLKAVEKNYGKHVQVIRRRGCKK